MSNAKVHIKCFGCQMNKLDSSLVRSALVGAGMQITEHIKEADAVLINTCSVREHAEQRVLSHLGHLKHLKKSKPHLVVGVMGCMAQRLGKELLDHPAVDIVCGPNQIADIHNMLIEAMEQHERCVAVTEKIRQAPKENESLENFETAYNCNEEQLPSQAWVRIMRGCDCFCSYCVVPYVRGPEISREPKAIVEQVRKLTDEGVQLVTLLGQRVNAYEYKAGDKTYCLADVLEMLSDIDGLRWIRFVTSYPSEKYYDPLLDAMANLPKVCKYLHIPAQSGSNTILKAMNRKYTREEYLAILERARQRVPDIMLAGDFIVGFPGETDEDFEQTVDLVKQAKYKNCFVFKYSPRPGTTSDKRLADTIPLEVKKQRNNALLAAQEPVSLQVAQSFIGKTVEVLVEGPSKKAHLNPAAPDQIQLVARTAEDWIVIFDGSQSLAGKFANVLITHVSPLTLFGSSQ